MTTVSTVEGRTPAEFVFTTQTSLFPYNSQDSTGNVEALTTELQKAGFQTFVRHTGVDSWPKLVDFDGEGKYLVEIERVADSKYLSIWPGKDDGVQHPVVWFANVFNPTGRQPANLDRDTHIQMVLESVGKIFSLGYTELTNCAWPGHVRASLFLMQGNSDIDPARSQDIKVAIEIPAQLQKKLAAFPSAVQRTVQNFLTSRHVTLDGKQKGHFTSRLVNAIDMAVTAVAPSGIPAPSNTAVQGSPSIESRFALRLVSFLTKVEECQFTDESPMSDPALKHAVTHNIGQLAGDIFGLAAETYGSKQ